MKMEQLTAEQESKIPEWVEKWLEIGLSTEPMDFETAKSAALEGYTLAGAAPPKVVLRAASPYEAALFGEIAIRILNSSFYGNQVLNQVGDKVWHQVLNQVGDKVGDKVGKQVGKQVWKQVWNQVWDQVGNQVWNQLGNQVWDQVWDGRENYGASQLHAGLAAIITFYRDVCLLSTENMPNFSVYEKLVKSCGWTWWHSDVLVISDRPEYIKFDSEKRLHSETTAAVKYRDGWSVYSWHGTKIPGEWVNYPSFLTPEIALSQENVELRRCACEILGWEKILETLDAVTIDSDYDVEIGNLLEVDLPGAGKERFLKVRCGTGRDFVIPVPPEMQTALEANSWTYGIDTFEFKPEIRT